MIFLAVKPPTSGGGYKAIINYWNLIFLIGVIYVSTKYGNGSTSPEKRRA